MSVRGRPKKSEKYGRHIVAAEDIIADRLPSLLENMFVLADGVTVEEEIRDGGRRIYTEPPDRQANEYLINRIMGKPTERVEVGGEDGGPIAVDATVRSVGSEELVAWRKERFEAYREEQTNGISGDP